jgi:3-dehydroquinate synthase
MPQTIVNIPGTKPYHYAIKIQAGLLTRSNWLPKDLKINQVVVVTDNTVKKSYAAPLIQNLKKQYPNVLLLSIPAGEKSKTREVKQLLENRMLRHRCTRDTLCIALGGGVVGDVTGYLAATYMRGIPYIQIPTTLLSMVDSSVGGKTGINTPYGKNLIGAFWQPKRVVVDVNCLDTLPKRHLINGLVEALKMFLTFEAKSFYAAQKDLEKILQKDAKSLTRVIHNSVKLKAAVVSHDEKEMHQRMVLNFGHTIGHALETLSQYRMLHGFAVGLGILVEANIAQECGFLDPEANRLIQSTFAKLGISGKALRPFKVDAVIQTTKVDKKVRHGVVNYVLLNGIGSVHQQQGRFAHAVADEVVKRAWRAAEDH